MAALAGMIEPTVAGMGFELVDTELAHHGRLVRIFVDKPGGITVDDCAELSRQLARLFAVEGVDYERLEVSSPGLDRRLRKEADFARFAGRRVDVRMRQPDASGRRHFVGTLRGVQAGVATLEVERQSIGLALEDMERARLVPEL